MTNDNILKCTVIKLDNSSKLKAIYTIPLTYGYKHIENGEFIEITPYYYVITYDTAEENKTKQ